MNGDCPVGSANLASIAALNRALETACTNLGEISKNNNIRIDRNEDRMDKIEKKQDWIFYLLITTLVAVIAGNIF